jgi:hypothetical protein
MTAICRLSTSSETRIIFEYHEYKRDAIFPSMNLRSPTSSIQSNFETSRTPSRIIHHEDHHLHLHCPGERAPAGKAPFTVSNRDVKFLEKLLILNPKATADIVLQVNGPNGEVTGAMLDKGDTLVTSTSTSGCFWFR